MEFRIGLNLGDVLEEERIYGDGFNIAARVESLAEGGSICISGTVSTTNRYPELFSGMGIKGTLPNFPLEKPLRAFPYRLWHWGNLNVDKLSYCA